MRFPRRGTYHATYFVRSFADAANLVAGMEQSVASSFGQDDDQWSGIDLTDPRASVIITNVHDGIVRDPVNPANAAINKNNGITLDDTAKYAQTNALVAIALALLDVAQAIREQGRR